MKKNLFSLIFLCAMCWSQCCLAWTIVDDTPDPFRMEISRIESADDNIEIRDEGEEYCVGLKTTQEPTCFKKREPVQYGDAGKIRYSEISVRNLYAFKLLVRRSDAEVCRSVGAHYFDFKEVQCSKEIGDGVEDAPHKLRKIDFVRSINLRWPDFRELTKSKGIVAGKAEKNAEINLMDFTIDAVIRFPLDYRSDKHGVLIHGSVFYNPEYDRGDYTLMSYEQFKGVEKLYDLPISSNFEAYSHVERLIDDIKQKNEHPDVVEWSVHTATTWVEESIQKSKNEYVLAKDFLPFSFYNGIEENDVFWEISLIGESDELDSEFYSGPIFRKKIKRCSVFVKRDGEIALFPPARGGNQRFFCSINISSASGEVDR